MSPTIATEILSILKKYYIDYDKNVWKGFLKSTDWETFFAQRWVGPLGHPQHGGYYTPTMMKQSFHSTAPLPKDLPSFSRRHNKIVVRIPTCVFNSISYQKQYIKTLRRILFDFDADVLELDFSNNIGGKTEIIVSGLLPLFLLQSRKVLTKIKCRNDRLLYNLWIRNGEIHNLPFSISNTKPMKHIPREIVIRMNQFTASAGEQVILALPVLKSVTKVRFVGHPTAGATTWIDYAMLSNGGGLEYPVGIVVSVVGIEPRPDRRLTPCDFN